MPRPRRSYFANSAYFASARVAEGLPFVPDLLINCIISSICARAQRLYPIIITDALWMLNHFHMLFVCQDPSVVKGFFGYMKGELASSINRLRGRSGPIWQGRSDTPIVLDSDKIIETLIYLYTNPQAAGLVERIEDYPGVSSWEAVVGRERAALHPVIMTSELPQVPRCPDEHRKRERIAMELCAEGRAQEAFTIKPFAWVEALGEEAGLTKDEARRRVVEGVRAKEGALLRERKRPVVGAKVLRTQSIYRNYRPQKYGRRVFCLSSIPELRKTFIEHYRDFVESCREVYQRWKLGYLSLQMPLGAFPPPAPLCVVALGIDSP